jgi:hypothetical protein
MGHTLPSTNTQRKITNVWSATRFRKSIRYVKVKRSIRFSVWLIPIGTSSLFPVTLHSALHTTVDALLFLELQNKKHALSLFCFMPVNCVTSLSEIFLQQFWCNNLVASLSSGNCTRHLNTLVNIVIRPWTGRLRTQGCDSKNRQEILSSPKRSRLALEPSFLLFNCSWE